MSNMFRYDEEPKQRQKAYPQQQKPSSQGWVAGLAVLIIGVIALILIIKYVGFLKLLTFVAIIAGIFVFIMETPLPKSSNNSSNKERVVAVILCFLFGMLGAHRFYVGKIASGIFFPLSAFIVGWNEAASHHTYDWGIVDWILVGFLCGAVIVDFILILIGKFTDNQGYLLLNWTGQRR